MARPFQALFPPSCPCFCLNRLPCHGEMARPHQAALKKAAERGIVVGKVSGAAAAAALSAVIHLTKGAKTARQALESCVELFTDPSRATRLAGLLQQQLGKIIVDPSNRVTWAALLHATAESPGIRGRPLPEMLGFTQSGLPRKAPTRAELQKMDDKRAWAWCVNYFREQVTSANRASSRHKFVFPAYKDGI